MKYTFSILCGLATYGFLEVVFKILFDLLYISFSARSVVEKCKSVFSVSSCDIAVYPSLWAMEAPLIFLTFVLMSFTITVISKKLKIEKSKYLVVLSYMATYFIALKLGEFGEGQTLFILASSFFHGAVFLLCICGASHLTSVGTFAPRCSAGRR